MFKNIYIGKLIQTPLNFSVLLIVAFTLLYLFFLSAPGKQPSPKYIAFVFADEASKPAKELVTKNFQHGLPYNQGWQHQETPIQLGGKRGTIQTILIDPQTGIITTTVSYKNKTYTLRMQPTINGKPLAQAQPPSTNGLQWNYNQTLGSDDGREQRPNPRR